MVKDKKVQIRLSEDDFNILEEKSASLGLSKSEYIRLLINKTNTLLLSTKIDKK